VVHPAEVPRSPKKPNVPLLIFGGILASLFLAVAAAAIADLAGGKLIEPWQVRRQLRLPLLGEVDPP
jgi:capsular polysaccharide biosynthesis protein